MRLVSCDSDCILSIWPTCLLKHLTYKGIMLLVHGLLLPDRVVYTLLKSIFFSRMRPIINLDVRFKLGYLVINVIKDCSQRFLLFDNNLKLMDPFLIVFRWLLEGSYVLHRHIDSFDCWLNDFEHDFAHPCLKVKPIQLVSCC